MTLQYQLSNGNWMPYESNVDTIIARCAAFEGKTTSEIASDVAAGQKSYYDTDWYAVIRKTPVQKKSTYVLHPDYEDKPAYDWYE